MKEIKAMEMQSQKDRRNGEKMEKLKCLVNMCLAFCINPLMKKKFRNRRIWLIGGNAGELFVDNSRAMYEYLRSRKEIEAIWVLNRNSPAERQIRGKVLIKGSVKAYLYFMNAEAALFSHSISADIAPYLFVVPVISRFHYRILKVFLNHGTVGFKVRKAMNSDTEKIAERLVRSYDINIADSGFEKEVKSEQWWNVPKESVFLTGYPRYDRLYGKSSQNNGIFFMPTWRNWIRPETTDIEKTDYFRNITGVLKNEKLNKFLRERNIRLNVYIHQLMHDYLDKFESVSFQENISLLGKDADITEELIKSGLLITDYSSVAYDYLFMDKPIIFFQFDRAEYEEKVGSYVNLNGDLFGEKAYSEEECVEKIVEIVENNFSYDEKKLERISELKEKFIFYRDNGNSRRVYELIESELKKRKK